MWSHAALLEQLHTWLQPSPNLPCGHAAGETQLLATGTCGITQSHQQCLLSAGKTSKQPDHNNHPDPLGCCSLGRACIGFMVLHVEPTAARYVWLLLQHMGTVILSVTSRYL